MAQFFGQGFIKCTSHHDEALNVKQITLLSRHPSELGIFIHAPPPSPQYVRRVLIVFGREDGQVKHHPRSVHHRAV